MPGRRRPLRRPAPTGTGDVRTARLRARGRTRRGPGTRACRRFGAARPAHPGDPRQDRHRRGHGGRLVAGGRTRCRRPALRA
ncbi:hypothetical protein ACRAWF_37120 [Streptomyces sp. L7]